MNANEIRRLAHATNELRPDWPVSSLTTFLTRELASRTYRDAAVALTWVAVDTNPDGTPASDTPKRVLEAGPWWRATNGDTGATTPTPPKRHEQCRDCGRHVNRCLCEHGPTPPTSRPTRADALAGANAARLAAGYAPKKVVR